MTTEEQVWESIRDRRPFDLVFEDGTVVKVEHRGGDRPWRVCMEMPGITIEQSCLLQALDGGRLLTAYGIMIDTSRAVLIDPGEGER